ncbi:MAG: hypothetical protein NVS3B16_12510 [Vulcanimicrobiaceae bacterium]
MTRFSFTLAAALAAFAAVAAGAFAASDDCRKEYVVPYAEQCNYAYKTLKKDASPANLSAAFAACGRAQNVAVSCVKTSDKMLHGVALGALYRDVTQQAEIAMFAQQFSVAEALLREKLQVLDVVSADAKKPDATIAKERAATKTDLADALAGECTTRATATAAQQRDLGRAHKYSELAALLKRKSQDYGTCAKLATTPAKRAYIEYVGLVALEESGRAAQAAGARQDASELYRICVNGANRSATYAVAPVKGFLQTVSALCAGRESGKYAVNQPEPLDAENGKAFKPLTLPKT